MRAAAVTSALALLLIATLVRSLPGLMACLVLGGLANALAQPAVNLYLARHVGSSRIGLVSESEWPMSQSDPCSLATPMRRSPSQLLGTDPAGRVG